MTKQTRLEESRDIMKDLGLPPGFSIGTGPDGAYIVINEDEGSLAQVDLKEEELPHLVLDLWRDYLANAPPSVLARFVHCMTAIDVILGFRGALHGGPEDRQQDHEGNEFNYECVLHPPDDHEGGPPLFRGLDDDVVEAVLKTRRALLDSLKEASADDLDGCEEASG